MPMQSDEPKPSFYSELAARRSRSARLTELAVAAGLVAEPLALAGAEVAPAAEEAAAEVAGGFAGIGEEDFALLERDEGTAGFDEAEEGALEEVSPLAGAAGNDGFAFPLTDVAAVEERELVDEEVEAAAPDPIMAAAENAFAGQAAEPVGLGASYFAEFGDEKGTEEKVANAAGHPPATEDLIAESEDFMPEEPQMLTDVEKTLAAEIIAERIGQVVDIQRFPKTKPRRVMAKVESEEKARQKKSAEPERAAVPGASATARPEPVRVSKEADIAKPGSGSVDTHGAEKAKKKRVSLLDNYFKGL